MDTSDQDPRGLTPDEALEHLRAEWKAARTDRERTEITKAADVVLLIAKVFEMPVTDKKGDGA